jgi:hypothetical protein
MIQTSQKILASLIGLRFKTKKKKECLGRLLPRGAVIHLGIQLDNAVGGDAAVRAR